MRRSILALSWLLAMSSAHAQSPLDDIKNKATEKATGVAKEEANKKIVSKINSKLLAESKKNQCSFKKDSDEFAANCNGKLKNLASLLVDAKKQLVAAGFKGYTFVVSGHTDSTGNAAHNKELSQRRAAVIVKELIKRGVPQDEIEAIGMGSDKPLVKPDNTPAKQAMNRRYEIQVKI
jgi:OmpA-OmpF porin, OOP family